MNQKKFPASWKNKRVVVTGAGGFIGSHLTESLLQAGARVTALVHYNGANRWGNLERYYDRQPANLKVVAGDVRDAGQMQDLIKDQEIVFHLAALIAIPYSYIAPASFMQTNAVGTLNVLEGCRRAKVRVLVHTSTSEVYGSAKYVPMDEKHPLQAQSPYAASKIAGDQLALSYHASFGLPVVVVRPFNTYGPRQSARAVIPTILSGLLHSSKPLALGDLRPVRDFTFVLDTVRGFLLAAQKAPLGETIHLGSGCGISIQDLIDACRKTAGAGAPRVSKEAQRVRPPKSEVWRLICSNKQAKRLLGWSPTVKLETGLTETLAYVRRHPANYKSALYNV